MTFREFYEWLGFWIGLSFMILTGLGLTILWVWFLATLNGLLDDD